MQAPAIPEDEEKRLESLWALNILDTIPEERYDRLTRLAKRLFGVPIALVSIIDADRQWFKSSIGLDAKDEPRETSFCGHTILGDDVFEVQDASLDERFHDNPVVINSPHIRFYAGQPLKAPNGSKIGTLCIADQHPRHLADEDKILLRDLARMVESEIAAVQLATMDDLTMLSNRRGFESLAQHALHICKRLEKPATLLLFDLNGFKRVNDELGHAGGDLVLQNFASMLSHAFRNSDVIARLGGDEFVVLLTNTKLDLAKKVLARLESMVDDHNLLDNSAYNISYRIGIIEYDSVKHIAITDLIDEADKLMYTQKKESKNKNI
ncbi:MAG: sensor domain-containing diguanylate cyclase [Methylotenera sp.]|nr:sensor domain-containing diguanylate cyclase [Methylotenera sp.]